LRLHGRKWQRERTQNGGQKDEAADHPDLLFETCPEYYRRSNPRMIAPTVPMTIEPATQSFARARVERLIASVRIGSPPPASLASGSSPRPPGFPN
jgi:hypothetical protein